MERLECRHSTDTCTCTGTDTGTDAGAGTVQIQVQVRGASTLAAFPPPHLLVAFLGRAHVAPLLVDAPRGLRRLLKAVFPTDGQVVQVLRHPSRARHPPDRTVHKPAR
eukprot:5558165-Pyramimonas_sp.AAC.1